MALSGDTAVVGVPGDGYDATGVNTTAYHSGAALVFTRSGDTWSQQAYLKASNTGADDEFGYSVAVDGDTVVIGAPYEDSDATGVDGNQASNSATSAGAAYVFTRSGSTWSQQAYLKASIADSFDEFGYSVAMTGDIAVIGSYLEDSRYTGVDANQGTGFNSSFSNSGAAYVFKRMGSTWAQHAYLKASNTGASDYFGLAVAASGGTAVIGAPREDSSATGVNGDQLDNTVFSSGAAYIFNDLDQAPLPVISGVFPASGSTAGGTNMSIGGAGFTGATSVTIGGIPATNLNVLSSSSMTCTTPANAAGTVSVQVTTAGGTNAANAFFTYADPAAPTVAAISPSSGSLAGGTSVTITGTNFTGVTGVTIGGVAATNVSLVNGNTITCTTPSGSVGSASVLVTTPIGTNIANSPYSYVIAVPTVTAISPSSGSPAGGTSVTITGTNFTGVTGVTIGGVAATNVSLVNGNTITCTTPSGSIGSASVLVTTSEGTNAANSLFTYMLFVGLPAALDTAGSTYTLGGDGNWFGQTGTTHDTVDAAQSGAIGHSQETWFETSVTGPGDLSFWWKVSSESGFDYLEFYINGVLQSGRISGPVDWQQKTYTLAAGSHTLRWRYMKDGSAVSGSDAGWVDEVVWTAAPPTNSFASTVSEAGLTGADAAYDASPHNDGVANLLKYAFNMNLAGPDVRTLTPGSGNSGLPDIATPSSGIFRFEFVRRIGSGLVYAPQKSSNLTDPGSWTALTDTPTIIPIDASWERVIYEEPYDANTTPTCFGRVQVTLPP